MMCWLWDCSLNINSNAEANISKRKGEERRPNGRHLS